MAIVPCQKEACPSDLISNGSADETKIHTNKIYFVSFFAYASSADVANVKLGVILVTVLDIDSFPRPTYKPSPMSGINVIMLTSCCSHNTPVYRESIVFTSIYVCIIHCFGATICSS